MLTHNLTFTMQTEREMISSEVPSQRVLELRVTSPDTSVKHERIPLNLGLVVDRSGSMRGDKLDYARQALLHVLNLLQEQDKTALVTFNNEVNLVSPSVAMSSSAREKIKRNIQEIEASGTTNLSGGWLMACQQVAAAAENLTETGSSKAHESRLNRTLLLTDGLANEGITDLEELGHHANELHQRGVSTSTFGLGEGYDEHLLEEMANQGGGNFYFIENPNAIPQIFVRELKELGSITAQDVQLVLELPSQVDAQVLGGWKHETKDGSLTLFLGDLAAKRQREVYIKLLLPPQGNTENIKITARVTANSESGEKIIELAEVCLTYSPKESVEASPLLKEVMERFSSVEVAHAANEALKLERLGEGAKASSLLENVLRSAAPYLVAEKEQQYRSLSKRMKHGLQEGDRKVSHQLAYKEKQRRS